MNNIICGLTWQVESFNKEIFPFEVNLPLSCPNWACSVSRLQADELFGGNSYANSEEPGQTTQNDVSDQAVYSLLLQCTFKSFLS